MDKAFWEDMFGQATWKRLWRLLGSPRQAFQQLVEEEESLSRAFWRMLLWRVPLGWIEYGATLWGLHRSVKSLKKLVNWIPANWMDLIGGTEALDWVSKGVDQLLSLLSTHWIWLFPLVPINLLMLWLHNVCWDHGSLWVLRGVKLNQRIRQSLIAECQAMWLGAASHVLGALSSLPFLGLVLSTPSLALNIYLWALRGVALSAHHDCPTWKGIAATGLHIILVVAFYGGVLLLSLFLLLLLLTGV